MSLVNDMLNDLEQRRSGEPARPVDLDWLTGQAEPQKNTRSKRWPVIAMVLVGGAAIAAGSFLWFGNNPPTTAPAPQPSVSAVEPEQVTSAQLQALSWEREDAVTRAYIKLSESRAYSVQKLPQGLLLRFFGVQSGLQPARMTVEPPVESIAVQRQAEDLLVTLKIGGAFSFSDRLIGERGTEIELIIEVEKPPSVSTAAASGTDAGPAKAATAVTSGLQPAAGAVPPRVSAVRPAATSAKPANKRTPQQTPSQRDMQLAEQARNLIRQGDTYRAENILQDFIATQPEVIRSGRLLASLWLSQQRYQLAESLLVDLLGRYPGDIELRLQRGQLLLARGETGAAVDWLMSASPNIDQFPQYYELLGLAARKNQQYTLSEQTYRGLLASDDNRGDWLVALGIALDAQGRTAEARQVYRQALQARSLSATLKQYAQQRLASN